MTDFTIRFNSVNSYEFRNRIDSLSRIVEFRGCLCIWIDFDAAHHMIVNHPGAKHYVFVNMSGITYTIAHNGLEIISKLFTWSYTIAPFLPSTYDFVRLKGVVSSTSSAVVYGNTCTKNAICEIALEPMRWQRSVHVRILQLLDLISFFNLPAYVALEIVDWMPFIAQVDHRKKIALLQSIQKSIETVRCSKTQNDDPFIVPVQ